jgi:twitching motility protein PilT
VGIVRLGDANVLGALVRAAVEDPDWWVREQCVEGMAELGDARAVPYLKKMAEQRPDLRLVSLQALRRLSAHDELLELAELAGDAQADVRLAVLRALSDNPRGKEAAFYVETCRTDDDPRVSRAARELLGQWEMTDRVEVEAAALGLLDRLLVACHRRNGEDLLLEAERVPAVKRLGRMSAMSRSALGDEELRDMLLAAMPAIHREQFGAGHDVDFSYEIKAHGLRFRVNVFRQLTGIGAVFRRISNAIPKLAELGLPELVGTFGDYRHGLVLVGGPTGAGKSTTLAALIDHINRASARHIVTIEDPVEFVHSRHRSVINQRELGAHAHSFARALRSMLRQDPDVILIGELRDLETIQFAVNAAETGHLVLATVHTVSAAQSVDRLVHAFAPSDQDLVRSMLGESLRAIVCQQLLQRVDDSERRAAACEVMLNTEAVANLIRKDKTFQIPTVIATHREQGMRLMDQELERLVIAGVVDAEEALLKAVDKNAFASTMVNAGYLEGVQNWETLPPDVRRSVPPPAVRSSIPPGAGSTPPGTMPPPPSIPSPVRHSLYPATGPGRPPRRPRSSGEGEG